MIQLQDTMSLIKRPPRRCHVRGSDRLPVRGIDVVKGTCTIDGCERGLWARGLCSRHYNNARYARTLDRLTTQDKFWAKVNRGIDDQCWLWAAAKRDGYGIVRISGRLRNAHRVSYEWLIGPIPEGLELDHLCRVRACVNPAHLEPVTREENLARSPTINANKTHCIHGHEFTAENTYRTPSTNQRMCRICMKAQGQRRQKRSIG